MTQIDDDERLVRWRLMLGGGNADGIGVGLDDIDLAIDRAVSQLYDGGLSKSSDRSGNLHASSPMIANWLGDIRTYFPSSVVKVMQQDALERFNLQQLLLEPELLSNVVPDVHLVATLLALKGALPQTTIATAREVVGRVVEQIVDKIGSTMRSAVTGAINRSGRNRRPKHNEIDWNRTIKANLKHYQEAYRTIIPENRIGYSRKQSALKDVILCLDQSGSMASSVVYAAIFGAVMASLPSVSTRLIVFDTSVVDLTDDLKDPIDLLFGVQLGGGTDINRALRFCQSLINRPQETILILISDLYEGGNRQDMLRRANAISRSGVNFITLLALSDDGTPSYDHEVAEAYASLKIPAFACTPDQFPDLMAAAISRKDIQQWAASHDIVTSRSSA